MALPKFEGIITIPTGGYSVSVTDPGGTSTVTLAAGDYYLTKTTGLLAAFKTALDANATLSGTYTVTLSDTDELATGKVTIACNQTYSLTWSSTTLRDILGFTGNISAVTTSTGASAARYLWLPNCGRTGHIPEPTSGSSYFGRPKSDLVMTEAPSGVTCAIAYNVTHRGTLEFNTLLGEFVWQRLETTTNLSAEKFWRDVWWVGKRFAYFPDRSDDAVSFALIAPQGGMFDPQPLDPVRVGAASIWGMRLEVMDYVAQ
jgi:hypothetical protein